MAEIQRQIPVAVGGIAQAGIQPPLRHARKMIAHKCRIEWIARDPGIDPRQIGIERQPGQQDVLGCQHQIRAPAAHLADIGHQRSLCQIAGLRVGDGDGLGKNAVADILAIDIECHMHMLEAAHGGQLHIDGLFRFQIRIEAIQVQLSDIRAILHEARLIQFAHGWKAGRQRQRRRDAAGGIGPKGQRGFGRPGAVPAAGITQALRAVAQIAARRAPAFMAQAERHPEFVAKRYFIFDERPQQQRAPASGIAQTGGCCHGHAVAPVRQIARVAVIPILRQRQPERQIMRADRAFRPRFRILPRCPAMAIAAAARRLPGQQVEIVGCAAAVAQGVEAAVAQIQRPAMHMAGKADSSQQLGPLRNAGIDPGDADKAGLTLRVAQKALRVQGLVLRQQQCRQTMDLPATRQLILPAQTDLILGRVNGGILRCNAQKRQFRIDQRLIGIGCAGIHHAPFLRLSAILKMAIAERQSAARIDGIIQTGIERPAEQIRVGLIIAIILPEQLRFGAQGGGGDRPGLQQQGSAQRIAGITRRCRPIDDFHARHVIGRQHPPFRRRIPAGAEEIGNDETIHHNQRPCCLLAVHIAE